MKQVNADKHEMALIRLLFMPILDEEIVRHNTLARLTVCITRLAGLA